MPPENEANDGHQLSPQISFPSSNRYNVTNPSVDTCEEMSRDGSSIRSVATSASRNNSFGTARYSGNNHANARSTRRHVPRQQQQQQNEQEPVTLKEFHDDDTNSSVASSVSGSLGLSPVLVISPRQSPVAAGRRPPNKRRTAPDVELATPLLPKVPQVGNNKQLDFCVQMSYLCNIVSLTLPVVFLPTIADQQKATTPAAYVAKVASMSVLGGALGKFVNGFVVQLLGGRNSAVYYHIMLGAFSMTLTVANASQAGWLLAGMEFCASIQWTSCSVLFSNHYEQDPNAMSHAITGLGMASNLGNLAAKAVGTYLLLWQVPWRNVAFMGSMVAMAGAFFSLMVRERPREAYSRGPPPQQFDVDSILGSIRAILGSRLFWVVGVAHAVAYLARTSDKVLGGFFQEATDLPPSICGGLTLSVTVGFVIGLWSSRNFHSLKHVREKTRMLGGRYVQAVLSVLVLAICANHKVGELIHSPYLLALALVLATGNMASSLSFQVYQIPNLVANTFGRADAPICLSFLDGMGYFLAAPIWGLTSSIVSEPSLDDDGWSVAWIILAIFFSFGAALMMQAIPGVLRRQPK